MQQNSLVHQAILRWEEEVVVRHVDTPRRADELVADVVFDVLQQQGLMELLDALETEEAETLRSILFAHSALRFPSE